MIVPSATISSILIAAAVAANAPQYVITDMGLLPDGGFSKALGISENGLVAGEASVEPDETFYGHAVLWNRGALIDLTGLGLSGSRALGVNNDGVVVGFTDEFSLNPFRWQDGSLEQLPCLPSAFFGGATDVDARGRIVGACSNDAVLWADGEAIPLGTLGGLFSDAHGINNMGVIVGTAGVPSGHMHAFLLDERGMIDLGTLGGEFSVAYDVNDRNEVVGSTFSPSRAFLWREGRMLDLGTLGGLYATANAINNHGDVVGYSYLAVSPGGFPTIHAFRWRGGVMSDLNALVPPGSGWILVEATDMNDAGQIVGFGTIAGRVHGFILDPIEPPNPADLNGDGIVNGLDLALLLGDWGRCASKGTPGACPADLDGNGVIDGLDLALLLGEWS